jgi:hypothetical protein
LAADPAARTALCLDLAALGEPGVHGLVHLLGRSDANVRWEAVSALGESEPTAIAVRATKAALGDPHWAVRSEAALALAKIGQRSDSGLLRAAAVSDPSAVVRTAALRAIEALRNRSVNEAQKRALATPKQDARPPDAHVPSATAPAPSAGGPAIPPPAPGAERPATPMPQPAGALTPPGLPDSLAAPLGQRATMRAGPRSEEAAPPAPSPDASSPAMSPRRRLPQPADAIPLVAPGPAAARPLPAAATDADVRAAARRIDAFITEKARAMRLDMSPRASDSELLRRAYLDLTGVIPPASVVADFLLTRGSGAHERKVAELLQSEEYVEHWANVWTGWLVGSASPDDGDRMAFRAWVRAALAANMPYDQMVRRMVATTGPSHQDGAAYFVLRYDTNPVELAARTARLFLGLPLQCAQCHDHKSEPWKQTDFYGVVAFFAGTKREPVYEEATENGRSQRRYIGSYLRDGPVQDMAVPGADQVVKPRFLAGETYRPVEGRSSRAAYAEWLTAPDNPYFAQAVVNRMWAYLTGRGFVEPLDWFGENQPPTHPELLRWLAQDFASHGYDLQYLTRAIMQTDAYQRSARTTERNKNDDLYLTHARLRPLTAEQLFYSLLEATNIEGREKRRRRDFESMRRDYLRRYRFLFGNDEQEEEEVNKPTISQALMMLNGAIVSDGSRRAAGTRLDRILNTEIGLQQRVEAIYLSVLSRMPTPAEVSYFRLYYEGSGYRDKTKCYEDLFWSLLNTTEFASNH